MVCGEKFYFRFLLDYSTFDLPEQNISVICPKKFFDLIFHLYLQRCTVHFSKECALNVVTISYFVFVLFTGTIWHKTSRRAYVYRPHTKEDGDTTEKVQQELKGVW